jgi:SAM-dependent methyltransferase
MKNMHERVLLRDNRDLTQAEFVRLEELRERIVALVETREAYVSAYGLDPEFAVPDANWKTYPCSDFFEAYRYVATGNYAVLNRLRFWGQVFSGFRLMTLTEAKGLPSINPIPEDYDNWIQVHRPDPGVYVQAYRDLAAKLPGDLLYSPPRLMGEIGWNVNGKVVSFDTYHYQSRIALLYEAGVIDFLRSRARPRVLEIGSGYGALALALRQIVPTIRYTLCDLPESLLFSGLYLSAADAARPHVGDLRLAKVAEPDVHLLPNYMFTELLDDGSSFDLVINTWSLAEMSQRQIELYAEGVSKLIGTEGLFFDQNAAASFPGGEFNVRSIIAPHFRNNQTLQSAFVHFPVEILDYRPNIRSNSPVLTVDPMRHCPKGKAP